MKTELSWSFLPLYFLLFLNMQEPCDACDWMISQYRMKNSFCLSLLRDMGGERTSVNGPFPQLAYSEIEKAKTEDQVRFLREATEQIIDLFSAASHVAEIKWERRAVDDFLNILSTRQLKELNKCSASYAEREKRPSSEIRLRKHFKKLKKSLKKSNYSADSSEEIKNVVQHHLLRMDIIAAEVKDKLLKKAH